MGGYYMPQRGDRILDFIMERGRVQAEGAHNSGQIWGNAIGQIGQQLGAGVEQHYQQKALKKRDAAWISFVEGGKWAEDPNTALAGSVSIWGPQIGPQMASGLTAFRSMTEKGDEQDVKRLGVLLHAAEGMSDEVMERWYPSMREKAAPVLSKLGIGPEALPETWTPKLRKEMTGLGQALRGEKRPEAKGPMEVSPGASLFDPQNPQAGPLATAPPLPAKPEQSPSVGSFEDFVVRKYGPQPTPDQIAAARKVYNQSDDRPYRDPVPVVIMTGDGPQLLNRKTGQASGITSGGEAVGFAPTTEQRNKVASRQSAAPVLAGIAELSEKINTGQGVLAKISGAAEKAAAKVNLDDDVSEYTALVSGFTPMLARMVGHTGVLTEQDVQSVKAMLPNPGDSKNVRDRKMARIEKILGAQGGVAAPAGAVPIPPAGGGVRQIRSDADYAALPSGAEFIAPDGSRRRKP